MWESGVAIIEDGAFSGMTNLKSLDMMDCHVTSKVTNFTFSGLKLVETIDLGMSEIPSVDVGAFRELAKLQVGAFRQTFVSIL